MADDRLPEHDRAFELFAHRRFDLDSARVLARSELEHRQRLDADERPSRPPAGRMTGPERQSP